MEVKQLNLSQIKYRIFAIWEGVPLLTIERVGSRTASQMGRIFVLLSFFVLTAPFTELSAQEDLKTIVTGKISDEETGELLENVNVFLSFTTIGTSTANDGSFKLTNIPIGVFDLVISRVGYERRIITLRVFEPDSLHYEIKLKPQMFQTNEVEIVAESPAEWKENLRSFIKAFIGGTENANKCKILNPWVLNFHLDKTTNVLTASSDSIVRIDNNALGYRLYIILGIFSWNVAMDSGQYLFFPKFEMLQPREKIEMAEWENNRQQSYRGSLKHFLWALNAGKAEEENYRIYAGPKKKLLEGHGHLVNPKDLILTNEPIPHFKRISFIDDLRVEYHYKINRYTSLIRLNENRPLIDTLGNLLNPLSLEVSGYWAQKRVSELLPMY